MLSKREIVEKEDIVIHIPSDNDPSLDLTVDIWNKNVTAIKQENQMIQVLRWQIPALIKALQTQHNS